ncbi:uncharacterized protein FN964_010213 [Alca torda]
MSENRIYADLNLTEPTRPRLQKVTDFQGKSCSSRTRVAVFVAVIILLLILGVCRILMCCPTASSPADSKPFSNNSEEALETGTHPPWSGENDKQNRSGCPQDWEKHGGKCYFFSQTQEIKDWNASRKECTDMNADLVVIENKDELVSLRVYNLLLARHTRHLWMVADTCTVRHILVVEILRPEASLCKHAPMGRSKVSAQLTYVLKRFSTQTKTKQGEQTLLCEIHCFDENGKGFLITIRIEQWLQNYLMFRSENNYYFLGLTYSESEKWKWINGMEHNTDMFNIEGDFPDYFCTVIGHEKVETASCDGSSTTQNMCEKAANILKEQKEN